jgi:hypothetical protein
VIDSRHAVLAWEPGKMGPIYAFPAADVALASPEDADSLGLRHLDDPDVTGLRDPRLGRAGALV